MGELALFMVVSSITIWPVRYYLHSVHISPIIVEIAALILIYVEFLIICGRST
jgi:hypothetical protein